MSLRDVISCYVQVYVSNIGVAQITTEQYINEATF